VVAPPTVAVEAGTVAVDAGAVVVAAEPVVVVLIVSVPLVLDCSAGVVVVVWAMAA
jgi:hypothetical protein